MVSFTCGENMKLITRDTDYAVRALCQIARNKNRITSVHELVDGLIIPRPFLRKILQRLNKEGLLKSFKGKNGGFILAHPAQNIYLVDLIRVFQGSLKINECVFKKNICPDTNACILKEKINGIEKQVLSQLKTINLTSLM